MTELKTTPQGREVASREAHILQIAGSIPAPATKETGVPPVGAGDQDGQGVAPHPSGAEPKFPSHGDEYLALIGEDRSYVDAVQATYYAAEAGRHADRMLGLLLKTRGDLIPRRDIEMLAAEVRHIAHGGRIPVDATPHANPCDCPVEWMNVRDTRCIRAVK